MKIKTIAVLSVVAAAGFLIGVAACDHSPNKSAPASGLPAAYYTCPMHPSVKSDKPGSCPICGMALVPVYTNTPSTKP
jgi:Cu(I)/Ag(I) efflux system membrane fusion protein